MKDKLTFEVIENNARVMVEKTKGNFSPYLVTDAYILCLEWETRGDKERMLQDLRESIQKSKFEKYWFVMVGYEGTNLDYIGKVRDDPNRKELLQVCEYRSDGTKKVMIYYYTIQKDAIVWGKQREIKKGSYSQWNFYLENVTQEIVEKGLKGGEINE